MYPNNNNSSNNNNQFRDKRQPQKFVVQADVHAPMEPSEQEVPFEGQKPDKALDQVRHPPTPGDLVEPETDILEPLLVSIVAPQLRQMVPEQPLLQVLPMLILMPLPDTLPNVPDQPISYQGLIIPRPLNIRLLSILPAYDNGIDDEKQPELSIRQPDKMMYRKSRKLFDEIQDEMTFRKHPPRQLDINKFLESLKRKVMHDKFLESLKRKVIHDYDIPISITELSAEY